MVEYLLIAIFDHCRGSAEIQPVRNMKLDLTGRSRTTYTLLEQENEIKLKEGKKEDEVEEGGMDEEEVIAACVARRYGKQRLKRGFANTMEGQVTQSPCTETVINYNVPSPSSHHRATTKSNR